MFSVRSKGVWTHDVIGTVGETDLTGRAGSRIGLIHCGAINPQGDISMGGLIKNERIKGEGRKERGSGKTGR